MISVFKNWFYVYAMSENSLWRFCKSNACSVFVSETTDIEDLGVHCSSQKRNYSYPVIFGMHEDFPHIRNFWRVVLVDTWSVSSFQCLPHLILFSTP